MRSERNIDDAIDRAVREIMDVEPSAGLRRRVLDRLEHPQSAWLTMPRLAAAAALVAIVFAAVLFRAGAPEPTVPSTVARVDPKPPVVETGPAPRHSGPEVVDVPPVSSTPREKSLIFPAPGTVAATSLAGDVNVAAEPLEPIAPIMLGDAEPSGIAPKPIAIEPLNIAPITIAPIRPPR